jgi:hypothetical protein
MQYPVTHTREFLIVGDNQECLFEFIAKSHEQMMQIPGVS